MKKFLSVLALTFIVVFAFSACNMPPEAPSEKEDVITVEDGYLVVNGVKTQYKVDTPDVIEVIDGYVYVNGVKTDIYVPSCNHSWTTVTTKPTCKEGGYDTKTCSLCGKSVKENETAKLDHTYSSTYSFDDNNHWFKCTSCDVTKDNAAHTPDADNNCTVCGTPLAATPGVIYDISTDGTYAEVIGYEGTATKVKIASEYKGLPVKNIYNNAFENNRKITSVIIPDSVTNISDKAFYYCTNLASVVIPNSIVNIGDYAFQHCAGLTHVVIPDSVITIGKYAFASGYAPSVKSSLQSVVIGNGVTSIQEGTFDYCDSLISVVIGNSVTNIGNNAFSYCYSLTSIVIPDSVTSIGKYAFRSCAITSIVIPDSVTSIGDSAFSYCHSLTSVVIPDSVTNIGRDAFSGCHSDLYTEYEYGKYIGSEANPYTVLIEITNNNLSSYTIHEDTINIASRTFINCPRLTSITIPDSVTGISDYAFGGGGAPNTYTLELKTVIIGNGVKRIGDYAFKGCTALTEIKMGTNVQYIGTEAFYGCSNLASLTILNKATQIGYDAFIYCYKLDNIYYVGNQQEWDAIYGGGKDPLSATIHYNYIPSP